MKKRLSVRYALSLGLALALLAAPGCGPTTNGKPSETYDYRIDMEAFAPAIESEGKDCLILANKQHPLGSSYAPGSLSDLPAELTLYGKSIKLESRAALAAEALTRELHARGYGHIVITSGYRTYAYQEGLFNTYIQNEQAAHPDWTRAECEAAVLAYSAKPGTSEHQTGLCMDLISTRNVVLDESFAKDSVYDFLLENAHHFGFILRYPKGKEAVTGYTWEPWHYRFVGITAATAIHERGCTLEEYLDGLN